MKQMLRVAQRNLFVGKQNVKVTDQEFNFQSMLYLPILVQQVDDVGWNPTTIDKTRIDQ